jgi:hypothetical protein
VRGEDLDLPADLVWTARYRRVLVIRDESALHENAAVGLDMRIAEVHVAADNRMTAVHPAVPHADDILEGEPLGVKLCDQHGAYGRHERTAGGDAGPVIARAG